MCGRFQGWIFISNAAANSRSTSNPQHGLSHRWRMHHLRDLIRRQIPVLRGTSQRAHAQLMFPSSAASEEKRKISSESLLFLPVIINRLSEGFLLSLSLSCPAILLARSLDRRPVDSANHTAERESRHAVVLAYYSESGPHILKNMRQKSTSASISSIFPFCSFCTSPKK